jgi:hypothetical protein
MVQDSGKTLRTETIALNRPEPVQVQEDSTGLPVAVKTSRRQAIIAIEGRWRIDDEWWRSEPISRLYYAVLLASGQRLVIYKDLNSGQWCKQ